jgi:hypothetical protein
VIKLTKKNEIAVNLKGQSVVLLVADLQEATGFYKKIGFTEENIGGHIHMSRGSVTFILHPVKDGGGVRPNSSVVNGLYFDVFCYTDSVGLKQLYEEFRSKDVDIVNGPNWSEGWSEFTIRDNNGYQIAFGG